MQSLPGFEKLKNNSNNESEDIILTKLVNNLGSIHTLEEENNKLKKVLIDNQNQIRHDYKNKIKTLIDIVKTRENEFSQLRQTIMDNYNKFVTNFNKKLRIEKNKNLNLKSKINTVLPKLLRLEKENKELKVNQIKTKFLLKKNYEKQVFGLNKNLRIEQANHKHLAKFHEKTKLGLKNQLETQIQQNIELKKTTSELINRLQIAEKKNKNIINHNKLLIGKINYLENNTLANEKELEKRFKTIKDKFEDKLKVSLKEFLDKEIEYKTRIDSLQNDLKKYIFEIKDIRQNYYNKENKLKQKVSELFSN
mgnify:FL=1|jgi:hypothetical protein